MSKHQEAGFTLVELMVVVSIIGILASIAIPNYARYQTRARWVEVMSLTMDLKDQVNEFYKYHGRFPKTNAEARLPKPEFLIGRYITRVEVADGVLNVYLGNSIDEQLKGKIVSLRPWVVDGSPKSPISWGCGDEQPPTGMKAVGVDRTSALAEHVPFGCMGYKKG